MPVSVDIPNHGNVSLHDRWIRERCACVHCVQDVTKQPLSYTPSNCVVENTETLDDGIKFFYKDGHVVTLPLLQLEREMNGISRFCNTKDFKSTCAVQSSLDVSIPEFFLWTKETLDLKKFSYNDMIRSEKTRMQILERLLKDGIVIVSDTPREEGAVLNFSRELLGSVRETHWGIVFDVKVVPPVVGVSHDLAYTGDEIEFHVDNPYRTPCIDYQLLHCIKSQGIAEGQGLNRFVDAIGCAEKLRQEDPEAFKIISSTPVKWENDYPHMTISPMIELKTDGKVNRVFHSLKSGGYAPPLNPEALKKFYDAKDKLINLFEDESNVIYHSLQEGEIVFFGNTRVLHSRTKFDPTTASRHLQGMYVDHDAVSSAFWLYRANLSSLSQEPKVKDEGKPVPKWTALNEATQEELDHMSAEYRKDSEENQVQRVVDLLIRQKGEHTRLGAPTPMPYKQQLEQGMQAKTMTWFLHDVGELFIPASHGEFSAALLRPYVSEKVYWIIEHHEIFQMKNYGKEGCNLDIIEGFRGSPHFDDCERFCLEYDQPSFDPGFVADDLSVFLPYVKRVFSRIPFWNAPGEPKAHCVTQN